MPIKRVLIFIDGPVPSQADLKIASEYADGYKVGFRNARCISDETRIESADVVAGLVPKQYIGKAKFHKSNDWGKK